MYILYTLSAVYLYLYLLSAVSPPFTSSAETILYTLSAVYILHLLSAVYAICTLCLLYKHCALCTTAKQICLYGSSVGKVLVLLKEDQVLYHNIGEVVVDDPVHQLEAAEGDGEEDPAVLVDVGGGDAEHGVDVPG